MTKIVNFPSPNFNERPQGSIIDTLVIHHTAMDSAENGLRLLCSPKACVSCHYLIASNGTVYHLVDEKKRAWHAGKSYWQGKSDLNNNSIGIELDNIGTEVFPKVQMEALIWLCKDIFSRHKFKNNVVAHADIAPDRKVDPNHNFSWKMLADEGIGIYSNASVEKNEILFKFGQSADEILEVKMKLKKLGYKLDLSQHFDKQLVNVVHAFKRHYVPESYRNTNWDLLSDSRLNDLCKRAKKINTVT